MNVKIEDKNTDKPTDVKPPIEIEKQIPTVDKSERNKCQICSGPERCNAQQKPEIFVGCTSCKRNGTHSFQNHFIFVSYIGKK